VPRLEQEHEYEQEHGETCDIFPLCVFCVLCGEMLSSPLICVNLLVRRKLGEAGSGRLSSS
jgi:hypothetical protein